MIVWSDGEAVITHPAKCPCKYCIIDRARFCHMMRKVGLWGGECFKSGRNKMCYGNDLFSRNNDGEKNASL